MHTFTDMVVGAGIGAGGFTGGCYKVFFHCITKNEVIYDPPFVLATQMICIIRKEAIPCGNDLFLYFIS